jgi:hypothetical protein
MSYVATAPLTQDGDLSLLWSMRQTEDAPEVTLPLAREPDAAVLPGASLMWQQTVGASLVAGSEAYLRLIEEHFVLRDGHDVKAFLRAHPGLLDLVLEAYLHIRRVFGPVPAVILELLDDPESDFRELAALVQTDLDPEEALKGLDWIDVNWWLHAMRRAKGLFGINVEFL